MQFLHTVSDVRVHGLNSYAPVSSKALPHSVQGLHTVSSKSVQFFSAQYPSGHSEHRLQTLSIVSRGVVRLWLHAPRTST